METIQFSIDIKADKKKVWDTMLENKTYTRWAKEFHEGSYYEGSWDKGSEIKFIGPDDKGKQQGMYSRIKENIKYQFISIEHLGIISNGVVDTMGEEAKKWAPAFENYTFEENGKETKLKVEMQTAKEYKAMFEEMWPRALKALKDLCEQ